MTIINTIINSIVKITKGPLRVSVGQRRGLRGASSVLGKGSVDRYTVSNIPKVDREGTKAGHVGHKRVQEGPKGCQSESRWVTMLPRTTVNQF